ncbi:MAG: CocE/NonD family hydrolase [Candidatus Thermoplasmatota archaeon]|nr:CocE/NonD family hydrolase [Candidatus Thermoplasmatota archaeon]
MKKRSIMCLSLIVLMVCALFSGCISTNEYMVPMRDGVQLATDVYLPQKNTPAHGAVLIRTPYNKGGIGLVLIGTNWAQNGWPTIVQDTRGRYASQGDLDPVFKTDAHDGFDTLAWIENHSWSNGKVATFGGSALGITQYLAAGENPPALACQYIQVATPNLYKHAMYPGGEFRKSLVEGWLKGQGSEYILPELWEHENSTLDYWTNVSLEDNWADVNVPAIHIGGWYDVFTQGTIDGFMGYHYLGGPGAQGKSKLIIGPWTHGGAGSTEQGELTYPANCVDTFSQTWFWEMVDEYTMGGSTGFDDLPAVTYYVMGDVDTTSTLWNVWRSAEDWPLPYTQTAWYFHEDDSLQLTPPGTGTPVTYLYDPDTPVTTKGGGNLNLPAGPYDQRLVENRSDVLLFTSPVLTAPYEATGPITARLFVSSDAPDTDFTVKLSDVYPDGRSMLITDGVLRMRNRNGTDHWELMEPGTVYEVEVDLWSSSYVWNTGHQIRVAVSSSNYPRYLNNPNVAEGIYKNNTVVVAQNTLYIDAAHPSCLLLPEIPAALAQSQVTYDPSQVLGSASQRPRMSKILSSLQERFPKLASLLEYHQFLLQ